MGPRVAWILAKVTMIEPCLDQVVKETQQTGKLSHFISNKGLLWARIIQTLIIVGYKIFRIVDFESNYLWYFTYWTWTTSFIYFCFSILQCYAFDHTTDKTYRAITRIHLILFSLIQSMVWLVGILYWALLSGELFDPQYSAGYKATSALTHLLHLIFPIIDLFLCKATVTWAYVFFPVFSIFLYCYMVVMINQFTSKGWPYAFLTAMNKSAGPNGVNWGPTLGLIAGLMVGMVLFFAIAKLLVALRERIAKKDSSK